LVDIKTKEMSAMKTYNAADMSTLELQNYLQYVIAPRPIALVSTIDADGRVNLSPFSFFNLFSMNPPVCVFSPSRRVRDNTTKHTLENLHEVPECVIHMVTHSMVQQTSLASTEYGKGINEFEKAGFTQIPSQLVRPPRVAESPVQMECRVNNIIPLGTGPGAGNLVLAEVIRFHLNENILDDNGQVDQQKLDLVARLGGDWYAGIGPENLFKVPKPIVGQGIGFDGLPDYVRESVVLTGNDLAQLANIKALPGQREVEDYLLEDADIIAQLNHLDGFYQSRVSYIHQHAKTLLRKGQLNQAWLCLLAGAQYEENLLYKTIK
jgi:flavin reductase (DIM6/NTAB) family NADH-FMN oxidoreductase RutF